MWGGSANVYNIGHEGGTYFWFNSQQNHDGFPMDGALVGVGSHNPQYLNPIHINTIVGYSHLSSKDAINNAKQLKPMTCHK